MKSKTIVLGLDGATFYLLDKLVAKGLVPNLAKVMSQGYRNTCTSIYPPLSPPAWATLATGVNPAKHGVFDFFYMPFKQDKSYVRRIINTTQWKCKTVFELFNEHGFSCGVINYPMGYPPLKIDNYFISGLGTPGKDASYTYPLSLKDEINEKFPNYIIEPSGRESYLNYMNSCATMGTNSIQLAKHLFESRDVDLFYTVFAFTDRYQHWFWKFIDPQHPQYEVWDKAVETYDHFFKQFDEFLGYVLRKMNKGDTLFIISDHGFGPAKKYFYINKFLYEAGLLTFKKDARIFHQKNTPDGLLTSIDWSTTKAYSLGDYGEIRINLRGREPLGIVNQGEEYSRLRLFIKTLLESIKDPEDGKKVMDTVFLKEEVYSGDFLHEAPDLLFTMRNCEYISFINGRGNEFYNYEPVLFRPPSMKEMEQWNGVHNMDGIFIAYGDQVNPRVEKVDVGLADIPATMLHLKGIEIPSYFDGKPLTKIFRESHYGKK